MQPSRKFVAEAVFNECEKTTEEAEEKGYYFLFNDLLIRTVRSRQWTIMKKKKEEADVSVLKLTHQIDLNTTEVEVVVREDTATLKNAFEMKNVTEKILVGQSPKEVQSWVRKLEDTQRILKENETKAALRVSMSRLDVTTPSVPSLPLNTGSPKVSSKNGSRLSRLPSNPNMPRSIIGQRSVSLRTLDLNHPPASNSSSPLSPGSALVSPSSLRSSVESSADSQLENNDVHNNIQPTSSPTTSNPNSPKVTVSPFRTPPPTPPNTYRSLNPTPRPHNDEDQQHSSFAPSGLEKVTDNEDGPQEKQRKIEKQNHEDEKVTAVISEAQSILETKAAEEQQADLEKSNGAQEITSPISTPKTSRDEDNKEYESQTSSPKTNKHKEKPKGKGKDKEKDKDKKSKDKEKEDKEKDKPKEKSKLKERRSSSRIGNFLEGKGSNRVSKGSRTPAKNENEEGPQDEKK
eukprot:TRINITY_DN2659_c0_g1_i1.p1 TRINITY_DN2659_c0_g1~~TRINITY_DN2659_c0_g1_i1.p1  ORF type:complete len:461 (-),score=136.61 TRINITY_DN2659_c0_g1_i1:111-1493(-)